jgi:hypothetical protein
MFISIYFVIGVLYKGGGKSEGAEGGDSLQ